MWFIYAIGASVLWGLTYAFMEPVVRRISIPTYLGIASLCTAAALLAYATSKGHLGSDVALLAGERRTFWLMVGAAVAGTAANVLIVSAVSAKSAPYATAIEITFPLFVVFFTWLFFKQPLNAQMAVGAVLIVLGAATISMAK